MDKDPSGKDQHEAGAKLDSDKIMADLVLGDFARALTEVCKVGTFGANKYSPSGWIKVPNAVDRYTDAMMRHYLDEAQGIALDEESQLFHAAHLAWNALARLDLMLRGIKCQK